MSETEAAQTTATGTPQPVRRGQIWRRRGNHAEVEVEQVKNVGSEHMPYLDIIWYDNARKRRGSCYEDYWRRSYDLVSDAEPSD